MMRFGSTFKIKNSWVARLTIFLLTILSIQLFPASAQAGQTLTLIAEDSFDYTGNLVGKDGGSGFTSAWAYSSGTSNYGVSTPGLSYSGITSSGGYVNGCSVLNGQLCAVTRSIPLQSTGKVFVQMIVNFGSQSGGGTPNLRFSDENNAGSGGVGANGGTYSSKISILDSTLNPKSDGTSSAGTLNGQGFLIVGIDYSANKTSLWLNPDMSTFDYLSTPTPSAEYVDLAPRIQSFNIVSRYTNMKFDELKVYKVTTTTEPAEEAEAARKEAERKRQEKIARGRMELQQALERGELVSTSKLSEADFAILNPKHMEELNGALTLLPVAERTDLVRLKKIVSKFVIIEKITGPQAMTSGARELIENQLLSAETPQKTRIICKILRLGQEQRDTLEKFNLLVAQEVAIVNARKDRLAARLGQ
jgi:hypothetical protein